MKDILFELAREKDIKLKKEEIKNLKFEEKNELELKNIINNVNKKYYKSKKEKFYSYILYFINIAYIYLLKRNDEERILIKEEDSKKKTRINKNAFLEDNNILKKI